MAQRREGDFISSWSFHNPTRITFGENAVESVESIVKGEKVVMVTSSGFRRRGLVDKIESLMDGRVKRVLEVGTPNPPLEDIDALRRVDGLGDFDAILALGGGSSIDMAKALSRIVSSPKDEPLSARFWEDTDIDAEEAVPVIAIPTTAGTGSEVTPTATVWDYQSEVKRSLSGDDLYPKAAIVDPVLTYNLPESVTVSSGLDAVSHALESVWNRNANPMSLTLATQSLRLSLDALLRLKENMHDHQARNSMMQASLMAGLAISQTRTALCHSMSYPLTMKFGIPHGIACSFSLPEVLEFNAPSDDGRLETLAVELGCKSVAGLSDKLQELLEATLRSTGALDCVPRDSVNDDLANRMFTRGRMENSLRCADSDDLLRILETALNRYCVR